MVWGDNGVLEQTREFGRQRFEWKIDDAARKWTRLEIWDVARNGLYTQVK